jgi:hypothetical protein
MFVADWAPLPDIYVYDFRVALGDGRYLHNDYDYSKGYWWADYQSQVGAYYDKIWATYYLAEAFDFFISNSKEDFTDSRYKNVSFATIFPSRSGACASLLTGDYDSYAPWVVVKPNASDTQLGSSVSALVRRCPHRRDRRSRSWPTRTTPGTRSFTRWYGAASFPHNWSTPGARADHGACLGNARLARVRDLRSPSDDRRELPHAIGTGGARSPPKARCAAGMAEQLLARLSGRDRHQRSNPEKSDSSPVLLLDASGMPQKNPANPGAAAALQKYVDSIDLFRQITAFFEQPLGDSDLPNP